MIIGSLCTVGVTSSTENLSFVIKMNKLARHRLLLISLGSFSVLIICDTVAKAKKTYSKTFKIDLKLFHHMLLNCSRFLSISDLC